MPRRKEPHIPDAILDQLLAGADPKTAFDPNGLLDGLKKALAERALNAEMDHHLAREETGNRRNGYGPHGGRVTPRERVRPLRELYGIEVPPHLISPVGDAVVNEIAAWQARPLEPV